MLSFLGVNEESISSTLSTLSKPIRSQQLCTLWIPSKFHVYSVVIAIFQACLIETWCWALARGSLYLPGWGAKEGKGVNTGL